jgi:hypothetical protein
LDKVHQLVLTSIGRWRWTTGSNIIDKNSAALQLAPEETKAGKKQSIWGQRD